jgi:DNA-binding transcriptional MerR regulator
VLLIGELARVTGTTTRALRFYEERGLLASRRTASGYRAYDQESVLRVRNIRELLALGFTVDDVSAFTDFLDRPLPAVFAAHPGGPCDAAMATARRRIATLDEHIGSLARLREQLASRLDPSRAR